VALLVIVPPASAPERSLVKGAQKVHNTCKHTRGTAMKRAIILLQLLCLASFAFAGFKAKKVRPKKPEQYQVRTTIGGVTYAADLLLDGKAQKEFFYKELTPANVVAVRLTVFNEGKGEIVLPVDGIQLLGPSGKEISLIAPDAVAQAVLEGAAVPAEAGKRDNPVKLGPNVRTTDPRTDRTNPRYDPRLDPNDPSYDPNDPRVRTSGDPRYNDPRYNDPRYGGYPQPGVNVILNPNMGGGGGGGGDMSDFERQLIQKDFSDKAHSSDPIDSMMIRDRFLYFSMADRPLTDKGFALRVPPGKGMPQEIVLKF
jgi:hypothetical protein